MEDTKLKLMTSNSKRKPVVVTDVTSEVKEYPSINKAAKFVGAS